VSDRPLTVAQPARNPDAPVPVVPAEGDPDRRLPPMRDGGQDGGGPLDLLNRIFGG
jgi:penicillin-binding protein 1A